MVQPVSRIKSAAVPRCVRLALAGSVAGLALTGAMPVAALAAETCPESTLVKPFAKTEEKEKLTPASYFLVAGGDFEAGEAAWTLAGNAKVASGAPVSPLTGKEGKTSLALPNSATATSPLTCISPEDRSFRFLEREEGGEATLEVSVIYESSEGKKVHASKTIAVKTTSWEPSPILETKAEKATEIFGGVAHMSIRFSSKKGTARIDDVYVDPRMR